MKSAILEIEKNEQGCKYSFKKVYIFLCKYLMYIFLCKYVMYIL